jgi:O-antigen ligase
MFGGRHQARHLQAIAPRSAVNGLQAGAADLARWSAIALGFSVITSTALNGVLMALLLVAWLASGGWGEKLRRVRDNEVAVAALALMLLAAAGTLWSQGSPDDVLLFLNKYTKLLLIPILVTVLVDPADRGRGLIAMATGLVLSLGLSYGLAAGLLPAAWPLTGTADNPAALKNYISHNIFMAYGVLLFSVFARQAVPVSRRWMWVVLAALAAANVLLMVEGRSGYVVLASLAVVALFQVWRWRGAAVATLLVGAAFAGAFTVSPTFKQRVTLAIAETAQWDPDVASTTSVGMRLDWYENTLAIIRSQPLLGVGTGGFPKVYNDRVPSVDGVPARNPHNQYLLTTAELGVVGLSMLLYFFYCEARVSARLSDPGGRILARGLLALMLVGCLFNSFLMDHNEGVFFCWLTGLLFAGATPKRSL